MGIYMGMSLNTETLTITPEILTLIAELNEFKGAWRALGTLAPERLSAFRRVATIESIGSSTRIEGSKHTDAEVSQLLSNLEIKKFDSRDKQEVAGYAEVMETVFGNADAIELTENHIKQLHRDLLIYSHKDERHRGQYKTNPNNVSAFDADGKENLGKTDLRQMCRRVVVYAISLLVWSTTTQWLDGCGGFFCFPWSVKCAFVLGIRLVVMAGSVGVVFETAGPFDTPRLMSELVDWTREALSKKGCIRCSQSQYLRSCSWKSTLFKTVTEGCHEFSQRCCCCTAAMRMFRIVLWRACSNKPKKVITWLCAIRKERSAQTNLTGSLGRRISCARFINKSNGLKPRLRAKTFYSETCPRFRYKYWN